MEYAQADSRSNSEVEFDVELGSAIDSSSGTGFDYVIEERFLLPILQLIVDNSRHCDKLQYSMYTNTIIVGNISHNV